MRLARSYLRSGRGRMNVLVTGTVAAAALALVGTSLTAPATMSARLDHRTLVLSVLLEIIGAGFVANGATGALYGLRRELMTLRALGWPRRRLRWCLVREGSVIALAVGMLAVAVTYAADAILGGYAASGWPLLAMPAAVALTFAAAWWPLRRATADPDQTETAAVGLPAAQARGFPVLGQAVINLRRTPARTVLGALMIAAACAALSMELIVRRVLDDVSVGAWLGRPASVRTSAIDIAVVIVIVVVTIATVADLNALTVRERASELRTLRAIGWSARSVRRLVMWEAVLVGLLGGVAAGALEVVVGLVVEHHTLPPRLVLVIALVVAGAGVAIGLVAAGIAVITHGYMDGGAAGRQPPLFTNGFPRIVPWP
jgi:hypothetical protein